MMKRCFDLALVVPALLLLLLPMVVIALWVRMGTAGPALYWSPRVGRHGRVFAMPKFRTMRVGTPLLPTDQLTDAATFLTPSGAFLRATSLDELPQLWSVLVGDMSLVGPRPALPTQRALNAGRCAAGVDTLRPGITGWAQINGRDDIPDDEKLRLDREYLAKRSFLFDLRILLYTLYRVARRDGVRH